MPDVRASGSPPAAVSTRPVHPQRVVRDEDYVAVLGLVAEGLGVR
jgi:hypothetical protein